MHFCIIFLWHLGCLLLCRLLHCSVIYTQNGWSLIYLILLYNIYTKKTKHKTLKCCGKPLSVIMVLLGETNIFWGGMCNKENQCSKLFPFLETIARVWVGECYLHSQLQRLVCVWVWRGGAMHAVGHSIVDPECRLEVSLDMEMGVKIINILLSRKAHLWGKG